MNRYLTGTYVQANRGGIASLSVLRDTRPMSAAVGRTIIAACIDALEERCAAGDEPSQEASRQLANIVETIDTRGVDVLPDAAADVITRASSAVEECLGDGTDAEGGEEGPDDNQTEQEPLLVDYGVEELSETQVLDTGGDFEFDDSPEDDHYAVLGSGGTAVGVAVLEWDNHNTYQPGEIVYFNQKHWRALREVTPPLVPVFMKGDEPGTSDAWREISDAATFGGNVMGYAANQYGTEEPTFGDDVLGDVDVDGLIARFDSLPKTNRTVWSLWVDSGHGAGLAERVSSAAQKMLNQSIVPTTEFSFHSAVITFNDRFKALDDKVIAQPIDDAPSPVWNDVKNYFVDGSKLANLLEGTAAQTLKWSDVKKAAEEAAKGAGKALDHAENTAKWTTGLLIGGAVVLGAGALYAVYKIASGPTGGAIIGGYLGGRR